MEEDVAVNIGIIYHDDCEGHVICGIQERPEKVTCMLQALRLCFPHSAFLEADFATDDTLSLYHSDEYLESLIDICRKSETTTLSYWVDADTQVLCSTRRAIYRAAGAAIMAVDRIFLPVSDPLHLHSVFCCVRPPGHHAERSKMMGFCFVNNAAVAAKYAQRVHGVERVAVLDFDAHHGNGTEEGFKHDPSLFYGSAHEMDSFPFSGEEPELLVPVDPHELLEVILGHVPIASRPPPLSSLPTSSSDDSNGESNISMSEWLYKELQLFGDVYVSQNPLERRLVRREVCVGTGSRRDFRQRWRHVVYEMIRFRPGLVILSAGFNGHASNPLSGESVPPPIFSPHSSTYIYLFIHSPDSHR